MTFWSNFDVDDYLSGGGHSLNQRCLSPRIPPGNQEVGLEICPQAGGHTDSQQTGRTLVMRGPDLTRHIGRLANIKIPNQGNWDLSVQFYGRYFHLFGCIRCMVVFNFSALTLIKSKS